MPYKFKGKRDCTQSDGSQGKFQTVKKDGTKRCYKSEKQYKIGQAWTHETNEEYGEEINEDIMRVLVKDFLSEKVDMSVVNKVLTALVQNSTYQDAALQPIKDPDKASIARITNLGSRGLRNNIFDILKDKGFDVGHPDPTKPFKKIRVNGQDFELIQGRNKGKTPEDDVLNNDAIGIFAEHACIQGLGGSSTIETARNDTASAAKTKYDSYDSRQKGLVDAMYEAMADLTRRARGGMPEAGTGIAGNVVSKQAPVDVYLSSDGGAEGITADVHVKFNDDDRLIGFQQTQDKKDKLTGNDLMSDIPEAERMAMPVANQFKIARNAFLRAHPEVMEQIKSAVKVAGGPEIGPAPEGVPKIKHLADYLEPDYELDDTGNVKIDAQGKKIQKKVKSGSREGELKTKSVELRMFTTYGEQNNRKKFIDFLVKNKIDKGFLDLVRRFFKEEGTPVYFFNYSSSPDKISTTVPTYNVSLTVTRMIGKPSEFTIEPRYDDDTTYTFDILYQGQVAFQIETRTSKQGHPPQLKIHPTAKADKFFKYKEEVFSASVQVETPEDQDKSVEKSASVKLQPSVRKRFSIPESGIDRKATPEELKRLAAGIQRHVKSIISEILENHVSEAEARLIIEELTGADKSEIKRMIAKEIEGTSNKRETKKIFQAEFDKELKKVLGTSFIGDPGKINKFVRDTIRKEIESMFKDKATQNQIGEITKAVMKKLYRELSFSSAHIVDRIKL